MSTLHGYIEKKYPETKAFIREFKDWIDWNRISVCQELSEDFIREFQDRVYWEGISWHQELSEAFIREFQDKVDWKGISWHQEFQDKVDCRSPKYLCGLLGTVRALRTLQSDLKSRA